MMASTIFTEPAAKTVTTTIAQTSTNSSTTDGVDPSVEAMKPSTSRAPTSDQLKTFVIACCGAVNFIASIAAFPPVFRFTRLFEDRCCMRPKHMISALFALWAISSSCAELFVNNEVPTLRLGEKIGADSTVGGYPIPFSNGNYEYLSSNISESTGRADAVRIGSLFMALKDGTNPIAFQSISANLTASNNTYWAGNPCSPNHQVIRIRPRGQEDHCLTIDPIAFNNKNFLTTFLHVAITNSASSGRYYEIHLFVNPGVLGVNGSTPEEWKEEALRVDPYKRNFMDKLTLWAEKLFAASVKMTNYDRPTESFAGIPEIMSLLPIPSILKNEELSMGFYSAVENLNQKPGFKALAFVPLTKVSTPNHAVWNMPTQQDADKKALTACHANSSNPNLPCILYKPDISLEQMKATVNGLPH